MNYRISEQIFGNYNPSDIGKEYYLTQRNYNSIDTISITDWPDKRSAVIMSDEYIVAIWKVKMRSPRTQESYPSDFRTLPFIAELGRMNWNLN